MATRFPLSHLFSRLNKSHFWASSHRPSTPATGHCGDLCWTCPSLSMSFLLLGWPPHLCMAVWAQSNESWVKANKLLPQFPGCATIKKAQDAVGCQGILPAHAQAAGYHGLQVCPSRAACQWLPRMHQWPEFVHLRLKTKLSASFHKVSASSLIKLIWMAARHPSALSAPHHLLCQQCLVSLHPCH